MGKRLDKHANGGKQTVQCKDNEMKKHCDKQTLSEKTPWSVMLDAWCAWKTLFLPKWNAN